MPFETLIGQTQYYVDQKEGNDANDGLSIQTAWKTLKRVYAHSYYPGDVIQLKRGGHWRETLIVPQAGDEQADLIVGAYGDGAPPIIDGSELAGPFVVSQTNLLANRSFEEWWVEDCPAYWEKEGGGSGTTLFQSDDAYHLDKAVRIAVDPQGDEIVLSQTIQHPLRDKTKYRLSLVHKEPLIPGNEDAHLKIMIRRGPRPDKYEYLSQFGAWTTVETWIDVPRRTDWAADFLDFNTGDNPLGSSDYRLRCAPVTGEGAAVGADFYLDAFALGERGRKAPNLVTNCFFEDWTGTGPDPVGWELFFEGETAARQSDNRFYGDYSLELEWDRWCSDVGVRQSGIHLKPETRYRFQLIHMEHEKGGGTPPSVAVELMVYAPTPLYWNGWTWQSERVDAWHGHQPEWACDSFEFMTPEGQGEQVLAVTIHRRQGTGDAHYKAHVDAVALVESVVTDEVYTAPFQWPGCQAGESPSFVYITGMLGPYPVKDMRLLRHGEEGVNTHPRRWAWDYDPVERLLYLNVGQDPASLQVECSVRDENIDCTTAQHIRIRDVDCRKAVKTGIDLGHDPMPPRREGFTLSGCRIFDSGWSGIGAGYRPPDPEEGGVPGPHLFLTPKEITIEDCAVVRFNRCGKARIPVDDGQGGQTTWAEGYDVLNCGIIVYPGEDAALEKGAEIGRVVVRRCQITSDIGMLDGSTERNGVMIYLGAEILVEECQVTGTEHGVVIVGRIGDAEGDARFFTIQRCHIHHTGDDAIWTWGVAEVNGRICYNLMHDSADNGIDIANTRGLEIYGNTFARCRNPMVQFRGNQSGSPNKSCAFLFNNVFYLWNPLWRPYGVDYQQGTAVSWQYGEPLFSKIDYNIYYQEPGAETYGFPMDVNLNQLNWNALQVMGFEIHGQVEDPRFRDPGQDDFRLRPDSPCVDGGGILSHFDVSLTFISPTEFQQRGGSGCYDGLGYMDTTVWFDNQHCSRDLLDPLSSWPGAVLTVEQGTSVPYLAWTTGAYAFPVFAPLALPVESGGSLDEDSDWDTAVSVEPF